MKIIPTLPEYIQYSTTLLYGQVCKEYILFLKVCCNSTDRLSPSPQPNFFMEKRLSLLQAIAKKIQTNSYK